MSTVLPKPMQITRTLSLCHIGTAAGQNKSVRQIYLFICCRRRQPGVKRKCISEQWYERFRARVRMRARELEQEWERHRETKNECPVLTDSFLGPQACCLLISEKHKIETHNIFALLLIIGCCWVYLLCVYLLNPDHLYLIKRKLQVFWNLHI